MVIINRALSGEEREILRELKGCELKRIEGAFLFGLTEAWNVLRLKSEEVSVDVNLLLEGLPVNDDEPDYFDETGVFSIKRSSLKPLEVQAVRVPVTPRKVGKIVREIKIFESEIKYFEKGEQYYQNNITKAIAFGFDDEWLVLDRKVWFDETIAITFCKNVEDGVRDDAEDWQNGDDDENNDGHLTMQYKLVSYEI